MSTVGWKTGALVCALGLVLTVLWVRRDGGGEPAAPHPAGTPVSPPSDAAGGAARGLLEETRAPARPPLARTPVDVPEPVLADDEALVEPASPPDADLLLHVVDEDSGMDLDGVDVLPLAQWEDRWDFPIEASLASALVRGGRSPVTLTGSGRLRLRVRARGYSWKDVEADFEHGFQGELRIRELDAGLHWERMVELARAARLEVFVGDHDIAVPVEVRLYPGGWEGNDPAYVALPAVQGGPTVFESLSHGDYQVRVELGSWQDPPLVLARREISLPPGESLTIEMQPEHGFLELRPAPLAGTLELPPGAAALEPVLRIERAHGPGLASGDIQRIPLSHMRAWPDGRTYAWDAGEVTSGRVKLSVQRFQISAVIELLPSGDRDVRIVVPELTWVVLIVRDAATGERLSIGAVGWSRFDVDLTWRRWQPPYYEPGSQAELALSTTWASAYAPGEASFTAPVGRTRIEVHIAGYDTPPRWVDLVPQRNQPSSGPANVLEFRFDALPSLLLGFTDGERLVPAPPGLTVRSVDGAAEWRVEDRIGSRRLGIFEEPGVYIVSADVDAELVFAPREVRIHAGERTELDIPVEHRR